MSLFNKLKNSLEKTRSNFGSKIHTVFSSNKGLTEELLEELEEALITADMGVETSMMLIDAVRERFQKEKNVSYEEVVALLKDEICNDLSQVIALSDETGAAHSPLVILIVGVNGTGKTTSIGKLAHYYKSSGKRVLLSASDTFRAAAVDQLDIWKTRVGVEIVKNVEGTDPAAVAFDAAQAAQARGSDVLIVDTAGRIHTNVNLMQELEKIKRVLGKIIPDAPHQSLLVIDAIMGQNAISQAQMFVQKIDINGLILTKLDGTAKGGAAIPIMKQLKTPIKYIGIGEQKEDFQLFNIREYVDALFD
ncbi:signal recognition particle-docking protein FtsY [candidate division KSB1 bacterium]